MRLKEKIVDLLRAGFSIKEVSEALECSKGYVKVVRWRLKKAKWSTEFLMQKTAYSKSLGKKYAKIEAEIMKNPRKSIRSISRDLKLPNSSTHFIIRQKLGYHSRIRRKIPLLSQKMREKRLERCKRIRNWLKKNRSDTCLLFSDEKIFSMDCPENRKNSRYLT